MRTIITLFILSIGLQAQGSIANKQEQIKKQKHSISAAKQRISYLKGEDGRMQGIAKKLTTKWNLFNNLYIVAEKNEDSLESFDYLIEDEIPFLDHLAKNLNEVPSPEGHMNAQENIRFLVDGYLTDLESSPEKPTREEMVKFVEQTLNVYKSLSQQVVDIQFNISIDIQNQQSRISTFQRAIEKLQAEIKKLKKQKKRKWPNTHLRPQDTKWYWHSQGMAMP